MEPAPALFEKQTLLTIVLFRTDAFAFICSGYARSESTWYVDWFATTAASHEDQAQYSVTLRLENECSNCTPMIYMEGISSLEAKAQAKTQWGGMDDSTNASASVATRWAGKIDCSDTCSASAACGTSNSQYGIEFAGLNLATKGTRSYSLAVALGGRARSKDFQANRTDLCIQDHGAVSTYAGGSEDNAQAKVRAGYHVKIRGQSQCGPWGQFVVDIDE